jgi:carboxymethylenebutenolidase
MSERRNILANDDDDEDSHGQEPNLGVVFDQHIKHEFQEHDVETTMETMIEPYVHHVPMMTGGVGYADVYNFYKNHFMGKMPDDAKVVRISRTIDKDQVVDEISSVSLTINILIHVTRHSTYRKVHQASTCVIMNFRNGKIAHNTYTGSSILFLFKLVCLIQNYCL